MKVRIAALAAAALVGGAIAFVLRAEPITEVRAPAPVVFVCRNGVAMSVWAAAFAAMSATGYLGDRHPGQYLPFWQKACAADIRTSCQDLYFLQDTHCEDGSGWACNELGILLAERFDNPIRAAQSFERACQQSSPRVVRMPAGGRARCSGATRRRWRITR